MAINPNANVKNPNVQTSNSDLFEVATNTIKDIKEVIVKTPEAASKTITHFQNELSNITGNINKFAGRLGNARLFQGVSAFFEGPKDEIRSLRKFSVEELTVEPTKVGIYTTFETNYEIPNPNLNGEMIEEIKIEGKNVKENITALVHLLVRLDEPSIKRGLTKEQYTQIHALLMKNLVKATSPHK